MSPEFCCIGCGLHLSGPPRLSVGFVNGDGFIEQKYLQHFEGDPPNPSLGEALLCPECYAAHNAGRPTHKR